MQYSRISFCELSAGIVIYQTVASGICLQTVRTAMYLLSYTDRIELLEISLPYLSLLLSRALFDALCIYTCAKKLN